MKNYTPEMVTVPEGMMNAFAKDFVGGSRQERHRHKLAAALAWMMNNPAVPIFEPTLNQRQIEAHMMLTSAFYHIGRDNNAAGIVVLEARRQLSAEMEVNALIKAITLSADVDYFTAARRVA